MLSHVTLVGSTASSVMRFVRITRPPSCPKRRIVVLAVLEFRRRKDQVTSIFTHLWPSVPAHCARYQPRWLLPALNPLLLPTGHRLRNVVNQTWHQRRWLNIISIPTNSILWVTILMPYAHPGQPTTGQRSWYLLWVSFAEIAYSNICFSPKESIETLKLFLCGRTSATT